MNIARFTHWLVQVLRDRRISTYPFRCANANGRKPLLVCALILAPLFACRTHTAGIDRPHQHTRIRVSTYIIANAQHRITHGFLHVCCILNATDIIWTARQRRRPRSDDQPEEAEANQIVLTAPPVDRPVCPQRTDAEDGSAKRHILGNVHAAAAAAVHFLPDALRCVGS